MRDVAHSNVRVPGTSDLEDREAIRRLTVDYAWLADQRAYQELRSVFADDAVWDASSVGLGRFTGSAAIIEGMEAAGADKGVSFHVMSNQRVTRLGEVDAEGGCYFFSEVAMDDGTIRHGSGYYVDQYVRTDDGWRISSRRLVPWFAPRYEGATDQHAASSDAV